ncbi:carboxymuconolactone decarboxylase family protein [Tumebacillus flagellatus]|uniref:Alkylhydroperoxidase n=1 Tax=Tumebacillus flagellatus TaxID=1157490 RepID=A0A074MGZ6_9BACL|nr:carboxymuconolactone decarboxylase family protein [Tumebacillus flagellatus]KEO84997.1 alkylhydroperoxidase [Tumebacillus flagellatus]
MANIEAQNNTERTLLAYKEGLGQFAQTLPNIGDTYMEFTAACFAEGAVSVKHKHLTALGISLCLQDRICTFYHAKGALENGASHAELMETVGVCAALSGGAALSQGVTWVQQALLDLKSAQH